MKEVSLLNYTLLNSNTEKPELRIYLSQPYKKIHIDVFDKNDLNNYLYLKNGTLNTAGIWISFKIPLKVKCQRTYKIQVRKLFYLHIL